MPEITVPEPFCGLFFILKGQELQGYMAFLGHAPRYLLAGDEAHSADTDSWIEAKDFSNYMTGPLTDYRIEEACMRETADELAEIDAEHLVGQLCHMALQPEVAGHITGVFTCLTGRKYVFEWFGEDGMHVEELHGFQLALGAE